MGAIVEKKYNSKYYVGKITSHDVDGATGDAIWRVEYDDGDCADYSGRQLEKILCLDEVKAFE